MDASALVALPANAPGVVAAYVQYDLVWLARQIVIFGLPIVYFLTGLSARFRDRVNVWTSGVYQFTVIVFAVLSVLGFTILSLPLSYWMDFILQPADARPTISAWLIGQLPTVLMAALYVIAVGLVMPFVTLVSRKRWWVIIALFAVPVLAFNMSRANSMPPQPYARYIEITSDAVAGLLKRCGVRSIPVFVGGQLTGIDGSGKDARILMAADEASILSDAQFIAKIAQSLKGNLTGDTWALIGVASLLVSSGLFLLHVAGTATVRRFGPGYRVKGIEDIAAVPLIVGLAGLYWTFVGAPALNAVRRDALLEADRFALEQTQANNGVAGMIAAESREDPNRLVDYTVLHTYLRARAPSDVERIELANTYKPWASGQPLKYADLCKPAPPPAPVRERAAPPPDLAPDPEDDFMKKTEPGK